VSNARRSAPFYGWNYYGWRWDSKSIYYFPDTDRPLDRIGQVVLHRKDRVNMPVLVAGRQQRPLNVDS
jgi:hypothetical protein